MNPYNINSGFGFNSQGLPVSIPEPFGGANIGFPTMFPQNNPGYPPNPGFPPANPTYPSNNPYPPNQNIPSYPPNNPSGPPINPGYPSNPSYPPNNPSYPQNNPSYPSNNQIYPPNNPSYPQINPNYPPSNPSYPQNNPSYPSPSYPSNNPGSYPPNPSYPNNPSRPPSGFPNNPSYPPINTGGTGYNPGYPQNAGYSTSGTNSGYPMGTVPPPGGGPHTSHNYGGCYAAPPISDAMVAGRSNVSYGESGEGKGSGTVRPYVNFSAEDDGKALRKAMKGFGTDEKAIIDILSKRSNDQRQKIKLQYKTMFGKDLVHDLAGETSFKFKQLILALMMPTVEYDASEINRAIKGMGTDEEALVEILVSRSNAEINAIKYSFKTMYGRDLERDLVSDTSGHFRRLLVSLANACRREDMSVDYDRARKDANDLYQAGEARWGTDESKFNEILCNQSYAQLRVMFDEYQRIANRSIEQSISREMSGDIQMGHTSIVSFARNKNKFFADQLYKSMKGAGTKDSTLIRVIVSRSEVDMVQIKSEFQRAYGQTLDAFIRDDTSGDYRNLLLALIQ